MKARWKNMTTQDRIINALIIILSVAVIQLCAAGFVFICAFVILILPLLR